MTATPTSGIRLHGGAPIPPAPSLGRHRPITANGVRLGATVELEPGRHVPVCGHRDCRAALAPRDTTKLAGGALYGHWEAEHPEAAA